MNIQSDIKESFDGLRPYIEKNKIEAYRLIANGAEYPFSIDIYGAHAVIHIWDSFGVRDIPSIEVGLKNVLGIHSFFYKNRTKEDIALPRQHGAQTVQSLESPQKTEFALHEYGNTFWLNLSDYLDTGLFLDHRETRKWIGSQSRGKRVLNTFAYTGSFSVYAAQGGAILTHTVDLSRVYCDWIRKNFGLNGMDEKTNWIFKMDSFEYLRYAKRKNLIFDIIVIDPPTFSRNKTSSFSVQKDHAKLIDDAMEILAPGGFILFSNNYKDFEFDYKKMPSYTVEEKFNMIPPDFERTIPHQCYVIRK